MITPDFATTMARYNRWQNQSLMRAASTLTQRERWKNRRAYFGSIAETLNHILWDDRVWLARMRKDVETAFEIGGRHPYTDTPKDWDEYRSERTALDDEIVVWADALSEADLKRPVKWMRGDQLVETPFGFNFVHMITHQTHHRGQVHAMLTAAGAELEATDLQVLPDIPA